MAFRNFVVAGNNKDMSFITKNPNEDSFVVGSPSAYVNNNDVDVVPAQPPSKGKAVASETLKVFDDEEDLHGQLKVHQAEYGRLLLEEKKGVGKKERIVMSNEYDGAGMR
nr:hypothetical protein [Tanacetum cinerariifolium]